MIIQSAREPVTLECDGVMYTVEIPTLFSRAAFRRSLAQLGAVYHSDDAMLRILADGVRATVAKDQQEELLGIIADFRDATNERAAAILAGENLDDRPDADDYVDLADQVQQIEVFVRTHHERYAQMEADRGYYLSVAPLMAFKRFVSGWDGLDFKREARGGEITDECMEQVPPEALVEIGWRIMGLMNPSKDDEKKAPSQSQSQPTQAPTTADPGHPTADPDGT